jgi:hypothetical protein
LADLLTAAADEITHRDQVVLISTHDVNLSEAARTAGLVDEGRRSAWLGRLLVVNAAGDQVFDYFRPDENVGATAPRGRG